MSALRSDLTFSMPFSNISHLPLAEQIACTVQAGFQEFTLHPFTIDRLAAEGLTLAEMKQMVDDAGLQVGRIDPLAAWVPDWRAAAFDDDFNLQCSMNAAEVLELAAFFGCSYVSLNAMFSAGHYSLDQVAGYYRAICDRAGTYGIACDLEPIPMWGVRTIDEALEVIRLSGAANAGLVFDVTHFIRGGSSPDALEGIDPGLVHCVQVCDGTVPATLTLEQECFDRLWPGEGDFPIAGIVAVLDRIGALHAVGPEVFSPRYSREHVDAAWIAQRSIESLVQYAPLREPGTK